MQINLCYNIRWKVRILKLRPNETFLCDIIQDEEVRKTQSKNFNAGTNGTLLCDIMHNEEVSNSVQHQSRHIY